MIVNTSGWDTDCNAANVGCLLGIRGGLAALEGAYDWRGPVADRLYLSTADGGRAITDALTEAYRIVNAGRALQDESPVSPKAGAKFHFSLPGAVQGFEADPDSAPAKVTNEANDSGSRWLLVRAPEGTTAEQPARALTPTFIPEEVVNIVGYELFASPTLYPGQSVTADLAALAENGAPVEARLVLRHYTGQDELVTIAGPSQTLAPGEPATLGWRIPDLGGLPVQAIGIDLLGPGAVAIDRLTWDGTPTVTLERPLGATGDLWRRAWVNGVDHFEGRYFEAYRIAQNTGRGLISQGTRDWIDYRVEAAITPYLAKSFGIAARVQGLRRYYALLLGNDGVARLIKMDDTETVLAEAPFQSSVFTPFTLTLDVRGDDLTATINRGTLLIASDPGSRLTAGAAGLVIEEGTLGCEAVTVSPLG
jgi:hypothetical protein